MFCRVLQQGGHVETRFLVNRASVVLYGHNVRTRLGKKLACYASHITKALHCDVYAFNLLTDMDSGLAVHSVHALSDRFTRAQ